MQHITSLTSSPRQRWTLVLDNRESAQIRLYYLPRQQAWYFDIEYNDFSAKCMKVVLSPNALRNFKRLLPFGLAFASDTNLDPFELDAFSSGKVKLYVLNSDEVEQIEQEIYYQ